MIPSLAPQHKGQSRLLPLATEVPREVQAAFFFKILLRKKCYFIIFLNLHTEGILSLKRSVKYFQKWFLEGLFC